jgi:hypothetical protein
VGGAGGIDFGGIGTVITALTGVLLTLGTILTTRQRHSQINAGAAMEEAQHRATQFQATARHVGYLESVVTELGGVVPPRPREMTAAWWAEAIGLEIPKTTGQETAGADPDAAGGQPPPPEDTPRRNRHGRHGR